MKKHYYIKNERIRLPIKSTALYAFFLYYFKIEDLWLGIAIAVVTIWWIMVIWASWGQEGVDLDLKDMITTKKKLKSDFQTKLEKLAEERRNENK